MVKFYQEGRRSGDIKLVAEDMHNANIGVDRSLTLGNINQRALVVWPYIQLKLVYLTDDGDRHR